MTDTKPIRRIAIIGTGVIGASWSSLFLAKGLQVVATDIAPNAEAALRKFVETAWPALKRLGLSPGASQSNLTFTPDIAQALAGSDLVQENGPERIEFKQKLYGQLDELLPPDVIIASSSSGLTMSEIQKGAASHPERCVIAHPFNPPHLIPLTEIVGGAKTSEASTRRHSATKAPPTPRGVEMTSCGSAGRAVANHPLRVTFAMRIHARPAKSNARPASAAKGIAESATGNPRAACPSRTAMYQRSGRIALHVCAKAFMPMVGKPTPA
ncbi:3hydroxyacylCoA dehydrogenase EC 11135 CDS [Bradyrhizobium sp.]|nr:3hydroxyacylCoA dehydrogenase EC 11135 CDS [Bradyrhizobium sp.]